MRVLSKLADYSEYLQRMAKISTETHPSIDAQLITGICEKVRNKGRYTLTEIEGYDVCRNNENKDTNKMTYYLVFIHNLKNSFIHHSSLLILFLLMNRSSLLAEFALLTTSSFLTAMMLLIS